MYLRPGILAAALGAAILTTDPVAAQQRPFQISDTLRVEVGSRASPEMPVRTRSVEVISRERLALLPVRTVAEALRWSVGVELLARSPAQADVSIRGAGFEQVLVLVDGVRMSDPQTGHFDLNLTVPLDQVERIEILRGPASAVYGADAVGGVVNVVTRTGSDRWQARVEAGSASSASAALTGAYGGEGTRVYAGAGHDRSEGHRAGVDHETTQGHSRVSLPALGGRIYANAGLARRAFGAQDFYGPFPAFEETRTRVASAGWSAAPGTGVSVEPRLSYRRHEDDFILRREDPSFYRNRHTSSQFGGELVTRAVPRGGVAAVVGAEAYREALQSTSLGQVVEKRAALFAEAALGAPGASATLGLRHDWHEAYGTVSSPSVAVSWNVHEDARLRGSMGRSFRAPSWTERFYEDPMHTADPDLAPELAWSGEVGADLMPRDHLMLRVSGWVRRASNLIDWARTAGSPDSAPWRTHNVESATFRGLEAELAAHLLGTEWTVGSMLTTVEAENAAGFDSKYVLRPVVRRLTLGAVRPIGSNVRVALFGQAGARADGRTFEQLDGRLSLRLLGAELRLSVTNLTDAAFPDPVLPTVEAAGRAWTVGVAGSW